jgi:hypothetical protein
MAQSIAASIKIIDEIVLDLASGCPRGVDSNKQLSPSTSLVGNQHAAVPCAPEGKESRKENKKEKKKPRGPEDLSKKPWLKNVQPAAPPADPIQQADLRVRCHDRMHNSFLSF